MPSSLGKGKRERERRMWLVVPEQQKEVAKFENVSSKIKEDSCPT